LPTTLGTAIVADEDEPDVEVAAVAVVAVAVVGGVVGVAGAVLVVVVSLLPPVLVLFPQPGSTSMAIPATRASFFTVASFQRRCRV
jgi:hypothetical protein